MISLALGPRSFTGTPIASNSFVYSPPIPIPNFTLPPERWSNVVTALHISIGCFRGISTIAVPNSMRSVTAAAAAICIRLSWIGCRHTTCSPAHTESKPRSSALRACPAGSPPLSFSVIPNFIVAARGLPQLRAHVAQDLVQVADYVVHLIPCDTQWRAEEN